MHGELNEYGAGLLALALLPGCATVRANSDPSRVPPGVSLEEVGDHESSTVPLPDPQRHTLVSLRGILAYADQHSPLMVVAQARSGRGDAEVEAASVVLENNPALTMSAGPRFGRAGTGVDLEVSVEQQFEIAGERRARIEAAERIRDLSRMELEEVRWLVHRRVHAVFHGALVARERTAAATKTLDFTERLLGIARRRLAAGDISPLLVRVAEGELAQARQAKIGADSDYHSARLTLAELAGWPVTRPPEPAGTLDEPRRAPAADDLLELALRENPSLRVRGFAVHGAEAREHLAKREAWPEPAIGLSYTRESEPGGGAGSEMNIALVTVGIPIPFWQRNQGERARARADLAIARAERDALGRSLHAQITRATDAVTAGADRIAAYGAEIIPAFESNLDLLRRAFELGEVDLLQVMVARGRFLEIERDALSAYGDYFNAVADLEALVGREIWPEERHEPTSEEGE